MSLDIKDTISSTFSRVGSKASLGVAAYALGLLLVVGLGAGAAAMAATVSTALGALIGIVVAIAYIAGAASLTVGSLRAFDQKTVNKGMFTDNILWPFLRMTGSNIVLQSFILTAIYLIAYPAMILTIGASGMMAAGAMGATPQLGTAGYAALGLAGGLGIAAVLYVLATLSLSLPRIAVSDKRMFQSLDESVQATKGVRAKIVAALIPFALLFATGMAALVLLGEILGFIAYIVLAITSGLYWLALLTELNDRL